MTLSVDLAEAPPDASRRVEGAATATVALPVAVPVAVPVDAETHNRRTADQRDLALAAAVALGAVGLAYVLDLVALLFAAAAAQVAVVLLAGQRPRTQGRRGAATGVPRSTLTPTGRVVLPATWVVVIGSILLQLPVLRWWACVLFALTLAAWPLGRRHLARVRVDRTLDRRARVGAQGLVLWRATNLGRFAARGLVVEDRLGPLARPTFARVEFDAVPPQGSALATTTFVPERRGWKRLRPLRLESVFPLGLFVTSVDLAAPAEVLVRPREGRALGPLLDRLRGLAAETSNTTNRKGHDEFYGLRPFRDGDDPRGIHWRTSARRGVLTYVERREETHRELVLCLARNPRRGPVADARFERAVGIAATVARAAIRFHLRVRLVLGEPDAPTPRPLRGKGGLESILDVLAEVRGDGGRRPLAVLQGLAQGHGRSPGQTRLRAEVVWVAAESDPSLASVLAAAGVPDPLVLCADDPRLSRWVRGLP